MITEQISMASGTALLQYCYALYTSSFKSISQKQRPLEACFCILHVLCDVMVVPFYTQHCVRHVRTETVHLLAHCGI